MRGDSQLGLNIGDLEFQQRFWYKLSVLVPFVRRQCNGGMAEFWGIVALVALVYWRNIEEYSGDMRIISLAYMCCTVFVLIHCGLSVNVPRIRRQQCQALGVLYLSCVFYVIIVLMMVGGSTRMITLDETQGAGWHKPVKTGSFQLWWLVS